MTTINKSSIYGTDDPKQIAKRHDAYLASLKSAIADSLDGRVGLGMVDLEGNNGSGRILTKTASVADQQSQALAVLEKSLSADALASLRADLEGAKGVAADLAKDFSLTSPVASGLVPFDLEAPSKKLTPRPTPLRNKIVRKRGYGTAHQYKRITGFTGTGTAGIGSTHPGISDSTQNDFRATGGASALMYARGPKISYAGDSQSVAYSQFSLSDQVPWSAQFQGQGFEDIRQLSQTSVLYASMLMEERMLVMGRGTGTGFLGALAAPTGLTLTARAATAGEAGSAGAVTIWVKVTSDQGIGSGGGFGESVATAAVSLAVTAGQVVDVTASLPPGALGMNVYVGTGAGDPGDAARFFQGSSGYNKFSLFGGPNRGTQSAGTAVAAGRVVPAADTSAYGAGYDGVLTVASSANAGYTNRLNGPLSTANPGTEFQTAFAALYNAVKADPDEILIQANDRVQLSDLLKTASSSNYRLTVKQDEVGNAVLGDVVTAIQNEVTGRVVPLTVHPWFPQGNAAILSYNLPIPDTQVDTCWAAVNVQDYMGVQWPVNQFSYDFSSYWLGTFFCYAPAWQGSITGIRQQ